MYYIHYEMMTTISLVTTYPLQNYYNIIDHISFATYYIHLADLFYNWQFVPLNPLHLSAFLLPTPPPALGSTILLFSVSMLLVSC